MECSGKGDSIGSWRKAWTIIVKVERSSKCILMAVSVKEADRFVMEGVNRMEKLTLLVLTVGKMGLPFTD